MVKIYKNSTTKKKTRPQKFSIEWIFVRNFTNETGPWAVFTCKTPNDFYSKKLLNHVCNKKSSGVSSYVYISTFCENHSSDPFPPLHCGIYNFDNCKKKANMSLGTWANTSIRNHNTHGSLQEYLQIKKEEEGSRNFINFLTLQLR